MFIQKSGTTVIVERDKSEVDFKYCDRRLLNTGEDWFIKSAENESVLIDPHTVADKLLKKVQKFTKLHNAESWPATKSYGPPTVLNL